MNSHFVGLPKRVVEETKSDIPLRTIKTVLHSMTRVKGSTILSHLTRINNTNESELHSYLMRLIAVSWFDACSVSKCIEEGKRNSDLS